MDIVTTKADVREQVRRARAAGKTVGFVPTMGYLHEGHASLMRGAKQQTDFVVASIFVNPLQFGVGEDYEDYPRDLVRDSQLAQESGVDVLFTPSVDEIYGSHHGTHVEVDHITERLCGASRPGHFKGVTTVVAKLFNIVQPDKGFFGQKDAQQVAVLKKMVKDLDMPLEIVGMPIVREEDGLALSSRNTYLSEDQRKAALVLSRSLQLAKELIQSGQREAATIRSAMVVLIEAEPLATIDYVELCRGDDLQPVQLLEGNVLIALAVRIGKTRLIDNLQLEVN